MPFGEAERKRRYRFIVVWMFTFFTLGGIARTVIMQTDEPQWLRLMPGLCGGVCWIGPLMGLVPWIWRREYWTPPHGKIRRVIGVALFLGLAGLFTTLGVIEYLTPPS